MSLMFEKAIRFSNTKCQELKSVCSFSAMVSGLSYNTLLTSGKSLFMNFIFKTAEAVAQSISFVLYTTINCGIGSICHNTMIYHGAYTIEN